MKRMVMVIMMLVLSLITFAGPGVLGDMTYYDDVEHDSGMYSVYVHRNSENEIEKICVMHQGTTNRIKDMQTEREICADVLNESRMRNLVSERIIPAEAPPGEPIVYVGVETGFRYPPEGYYFIVSPCMISEEWKEKNIFHNGLDTYEKRVEIYEEVLLSAVLQDLTGENWDTYLSVVENLLFAAANSISVPLDIKPFLDAALNGGDLSMGNGDTLKRTLEYLYTFLDKHQVPYLTEFKGLADKFAKNLDNISLAVSSINFLYDFSSAIFKGILVNALATGEAELRLEALEQWVDENSDDVYMDPAIVHALSHVRDAFDEYRNGTWPAIRDALFRMEMGVSFSSFFTSVGSFILENSGNAIAACVATGISWVGASLFLAIKTWMAISDSNRQARIVCAAATLEYMLKEKTPLQDTFPRKNSRIVNIRHYLAYYYYLKTYELNTDSLLAWLNWIKLAPWNEELLLYIDQQKRSYENLLPPYYMPLDEVPGFIAKIGGPDDAEAPYVRDAGYENRPDTSIILLFNETINPAFLTSETIILTGSDSGALPFSFHYNSDEMSLTITPDNDLEYDEIITLVLDSSIEDLSGNPMAAPYSLGFSISIPYMPPAYLIIPSLQVSPQQVDPYEPYTISGYVENDHGDALSLGTAAISMDGHVIGTTSVSNGSFQIRLNAPENRSLFPVNKNVVVKVFDGRISTLDPQDFVILTLNGLAPKKGYDFVSLKTYAGLEGMTPVNETSRFPREINSKVYVALQLEHLMVSCSIQFQFIRPDGSFYEEHIVSIDPNVVGESHLIIFVRNLGMGEYGLMGDWTCKVVVTPSGGEPEHVDSISYTVGYNVAGHQLCESVAGTPLQPVNPGNYFTTDMEEIHSFINFTDVAEALSLRWVFKGPDHYEKEIFRERNAPGVSGIAEYGVSAVLPIAGTDVEFKCGEWSVDIYSMDPGGHYTLAGTDYFTLSENPAVPPEIAVSMESDEPVENKNLDIHLSVTDNNYLKKVVLHWKNGFSLYRTWYPADTGTFDVVYSIGTMFNPGDVIEYWGEAWDVSGNYSHSRHQFINVLKETISPPFPPVTVRAVQAGVPVAVHAEGALSNAGSELEYQYDWGNGEFSSWGPAALEHNYSSEGIFSIRVKARSVNHPEIESGWSGISFLTVDSTPPVIQMITNNGGAIASNNPVIIIEGTVTDPGPGSGVAFTINNLDSINEGSAENWRFSLPRDEEFTTYTITAGDEAGNSSTLLIHVEPGPEIEYFPLSVEFPLTETGLYTDTQVRVKNCGYGLFSGDAEVSPPFYIINSRTLALSHNEEQIIELRFLPDNNGKYDGELIISESPGISVHLSGEGSDSPLITLDSTELNFGVVETGSFRELSLTITNAGFGVLSGSVEVEPPFTISPGEETYNLLHAETARIPIRFVPGGEGAYTCHVILDSENSIGCTLMGTGSREPVFYSFVNGDGNPSSRAEAVYMIRDFHYHYADTEEIIAGKGKSGRFIETWLSYPDLFTGMGSGIPENARISFGTLRFHIRDYYRDSPGALQLFLYRIKDPYHSGWPVYPAASGITGGSFKTGGLDYYYRDNRPGRKIPWGEPGVAADGSLADLLSGYEPSAVATLDPGLLEKNNITEISFDVTDDIKAWLDGEENQGWVLLCGHAAKPGMTVELYGPHAGEKDLRPALQVSYDTDSTKIPPEPAVMFEGDCGDREVTLTWEFPGSNFTGARVIRKKGSAPLHPYDGSLVIDTERETMYTDINLENGREYYYSLYIYDGPMNFSKDVTRVLIPGTPPPPEFLPPLIGPGYVILTWEPSECADFYRVFRKEKDTGHRIMAGEVTGEYFQDENIGSPGYTYEIHACNSYGVGHVAEIDIDDIPVSTEYPLAPEITSITITEDYSVCLEWVSQGTRESGYNIERKVDGGMWQPLAEMDFTDKRYSDNDIIPGACIEYRLYSHNSLGLSREGDTQSITIPDFPGKPINFTWNFITSTSLKMEWEQPFDNIEEYRITQYGPGENPLFTEILPGESRFYYVHHFLPEQISCFSLSAINSQGKQTLFTEYISSRTGIKQDLPYEYIPPEVTYAVPAELSVIPRDSHSLIIQWSPVAGVYTYELFRSLSRDGKTTLIYKGKQRFYYDKSVTTGTDYYYRVQAVYPDGRGPLSPAVGGRPSALSSPPPVPGNFRIYREDLSSLSLAWEDMQNTLTYRVFRSNTPETGQWTAVYTGESTSFNDTNLNPGTCYYYKIYGINETGTGPSSKTIQGMTKNRPFSPYIKQIHTLGIDSLQITWDSFGPVDRFHLYRSRSFAGVYHLVYSGPDREYIDMGLDHDSTYYYKVIGINVYGSSINSFPVPGITGVIPLPPGNLRKEADTLTTISLAWDSSGHAESYMLHRSLTEESGYTEVYAGDSIMYEDTGLAPGTMYYYKVQAVGEFGVSDMSSPLPARTGSLLPSPGGLTVQQGETTTSLVISWEIVESADSYTIYGAENIDGEYQLLYNGSQITYTHTGLLSNSEYYYTVATVNDYGTGPFSEPVSGLTGSLPGIPGNFHIAGESITSMTIEWDPVPFADEYVVCRDTDEAGPFDDTVYSGSDLTYTDLSLQPNSPYYYKITSSNKFGESPSSNWISGTTLFIESFSATDRNSYAFLSDGSVWGWGANNKGQLGDGTMISTGTPTLIPDLSHIKKITGGTEYNHYALAQDGSVYAWGDNSDGLLGLGNTTSCSTPTCIPQLSDIQDISAGETHVLALDSNGVIWVWGENEKGEIGDGTTNEHLSPIKMTGVPVFSQVAAGDEFSLALDSNGNVWAWGRTSNGCLGTGHDTESPYYETRPVQVPGLHSIVQIHSGGLHGLALRNDGILFIWGDNQFGQQGNGLIDEGIPFQYINYKPVPVPGLNNVAEIIKGFSASNRTAIRKNDNTVWGWGYNGGSAGVIGTGDDTVDNYLEPIQAAVVPLDAMNITIGDIHTLFITPGGLLMSWGSNSNGKLGDGTTQNRIHPVEVLW